jgi:hypothetical protein
MYNLLILYEVLLLLKQFHRKVCKPRCRQGALCAQALVLFFRLCRRQERVHCLYVFEHMLATTATSVAVHTGALTAVGPCMTDTAAGV